MQSIDEIAQTIASHLSIFEDTSTRERPAKRRAMEAVKRETLHVKNIDDASTAAIALLKSLRESIFMCSNSAIESVREQTVDILKSLLDRCERGKIPNSIVDSLLQHVLERLKVEATEEVRDAWMLLCATLLSKLASGKIPVKTGELFMDIMEVAGNDPYSEIQKQCAILIVLYAKDQPKSVDYACEKMVKLILPMLLHKHAAVRVKGIKAMEAVLTASPKGLHLLFEYNEQLDRQPVIPSLIYDNSALVRDNLFIVLGSLLCSWNPRDRYQYGERILPIILSGTLDDLPSVRSTCKASLSDVGRSCTQDLLDADIIKEIPADDKQVIATGLKHLVHMCYDHSVSYMLQGITDFITVKQEIGLDSLKLFLEYASSDDLVKSIKKLVHYLFIAYANHTESTTEDKIYETLNLILQRLPSPEIYLDALLPRLESKSLAAETNGYSGIITAGVVLAFLKHFVKTVTVTDSIRKRILASIDRPYLGEYIDREKLDGLRSDIA
ncbi:uncharacterized protein ATC70_009702 [Mucor velutinosus]|uniref:Dynein axonemal assembly factor 5 TPR repeats domain-containing protein n=1 Tax=Mucor velutinosus TaxID=708070 RepID=A0AAN7DL95_9FUNG|nr:hypothetical protein ATC70_009702 [Mucor velutinosus]